MGELTIQKYFGRSIKNDLSFLEEELRELNIAHKDSLFSEMIHDALSCLDWIISKKIENPSYLTANIGNKIIGVC
jgi:hypothetical protein